MAVISNINATAEKKAKEQAIHPDYYNDGEVTCIDAMVSAFGAKATMDFCALNAFKYLWRGGKKTADPTEDWQKANWYLNEAIKLHDMSGEKE